MKRDCPHKDKTCSICGKVGHLKATCTQNKAGATKKMTPNEWKSVKKTISKSGKKSAKETSCFCCGKTGHLLADCPHKDKTCSVCGKVGHLKATCRAEGGDAFKEKTEAAGKKCYICGELGHVKRDCPQLGGGGGGGGGGKKVKEAAPTMEGLDADMDDYFKTEDEEPAAAEAPPAADGEVAMEETAAPVEVAA